MGFRRFEWKRLLAFALPFALLAPHHASLGACVLPVPDGDGPAPTRANIIGDVDRVDLPFVFVLNKETDVVEQLTVAGLAEVNTVFGGSESVAAVRKGMQVWAWFRDCKRPDAGIPSLAYLMIYSRDPNDRATLDKSGKVVAGSRH